MAAHPECTVGILNALVQIAGCPLVKDDILQIVPDIYESIVVQRTSLPAEMIFGALLQLVATCWQASGQPQYVETLVQQGIISLTFTMVGNIEDTHSVLPLAAVGVVRALIECSCLFDPSELQLIRAHLTDLPSDSDEFADMLSAAPGLCNTQVSTSAGGSSQATFAEQQTIVALLYADHAMGSAQPLLDSFSLGQALESFVSNVSESSASGCGVTASCIYRVLSLMASSHADPTQPNPYVPSAAAMDSLLHLMQLSGLWVHGSHLSSSSTVAASVPITADPSALSLILSFGHLSKYSHDICHRVLLTQGTQSSYQQCLAHHLIEHPSTLQSHILPILDISDETSLAGIITQLQTGPSFKAATARSLATPILEALLPISLIFLRPDSTANCLSLLSCLQSVLLLEPTMASFAQALPNSLDPPVARAVCSLLLTQLSWILVPQNADSLVNSDPQQESQSPNDFIPIFCSAASILSTLVTRSYLYKSPDTFHEICTTATTSGSLPSLLKAASFALLQRSSPLDACGISASNLLANILMCKSHAAGTHSAGGGPTVLRLPVLSLPLLLSLCLNSNLALKKACVMQLAASAIAAGIIQDCPPQGLATVTVWQAMMGFCTVIQDTMMHHEPECKHAAVGLLCALSTATIPRRSGISSPAILESPIWMELAFRLVGQLCDDLHPNSTSAPQDEPRPDTLLCIAVIVHFRPSWITQFVSSKEFVKLVTSLHGLPLTAWGPLLYIYTEVVDPESLQGLTPHHAKLSEGFEKALAVHTEH
eukprot:gene2296-499_t